MKKSKRDVKKRRYSRELKSGYNFATNKKLTRGQKAFRICFIRGEKFLPYKDYLSNSDNHLKTSVINDEFAKGDNSLTNNLLKKYPSKTSAMSYETALKKGYITSSEYNKLNKNKRVDNLDYSTRDYRKFDKLVGIDSNHNDIIKEAYRFYPKSNVKQAREYAERTGSKIVFEDKGVLGKNSDATYLVYKDFDMLPHHLKAFVKN